MKRITNTALLSFLLLATTVASAQNSPEYGQGLKFNLNTEGSKYLRFIFWNQIWISNSKNNPGTAVNGEAADRTFEIGARRIRAIAYAQLSPRYLILVHFGMNNQTFLNGGAPGNSGTGANGAGKKPQLFIHDAWNEYAVLPVKDPETGKANKTSLYLGAGLHYWNGISRMTSASTGSFLLIDAPSFNWPTNEMSDQLIRQYGIYAKGNTGKLHYRFNLNKPFATATAPVAGGPAVDNNGNPKAGVGGYADYRLFDQESDVLPYRVGTYLGTKKVLNIGAGFYRNADATKTLSENKVLTKHDIGVYAADVFADLPVGAKDKGMAVTAYGAFYNYNFGPKYIRTTGVMNVGTADTCFAGVKAQEGAGNNRYLLGTGNIGYVQAGFLLPKSVCKKLRIQPMAAYTVKNLDALSEPGGYYDIGSNFFIDSHNAKVTVQYSSRPLYNNNRVFRRAGEWLMQLQVNL